MAEQAERAEQQERLEGRDPGRRRAAGIYGAVVTAAVIAAVQDQVPTRALVVAVLVTLLVYWIAEQYAELLGENAERGHLPTWPHIRAGLAASWPMVAASFVPLLALVASRLAGASTATAANVALIVAVVLLVYHAWSAGRAAHLTGRALLIATSVAAVLGVAMVLLKDLVLIHMH